MRPGGRAENVGSVGAEGKAQEKAKQAQAGKGQVGERGPQRDQAVAECVDRPPDQKPGAVVGGKRLLGEFFAFAGFD